MSRIFSHADLADLVRTELDPDDAKWLEDAVSDIVAQESARALFLQYSLLTSRIAEPQETGKSTSNNNVQEFAASRGINTLELSRIYMLSSVLTANPDCFVPKVRQLIQIADKGELCTFLTYLVLLPNPENFKEAAVEALRTNIATVFDAIALNNPYPAEYMTEPEWNQLYLKAAFMQRPLNKIEKIDERANAPLARIISDYAHERWAASRTVDPYIWRPVGRFINSELEGDMKRLLESTDRKEQIAAALSIRDADSPSAEKLLTPYPELSEALENNRLSWADVIS